MSLLALGFLFALSIVPTSVRSVKQAEDMEAAVAYATEIIESARVSLPPAGTVRFARVFNRTSFTFSRQVLPLADPSLTDVVVEVHWSDTHPAMRFGTRLRARTAEEAAR